MSYSPIGASSKKLIPRMGTQGMSGANGATGYCQQRRWPLCCFCGKSGGEKMARKDFLSATKPLARSRALLLVASVVLAVLVACGVAAVAKLEPAKAAFPGKNGAIAFSSNEGSAGNGFQVWRVNPNGSGQERAHRLPYRQPQPQPGVVGRRQEDSLRQLRALASPRRQLLPQRRLGDGRQRLRSGEGHLGGAPPSYLGAFLVPDR